MSELNKNKIFTISAKFLIVLATLLILFILCIGLVFFFINEQAEDRYNTKNFNEKKVELDRIVNVILSISKTEGNNIEFTIDGKMIVNNTNITDMDKELFVLYKDIYQFGNNDLNRIVLNGTDILFGFEGNDIAFIYSIDGKKPEFNIPYNEFNRKNIAKNWYYFRSKPKLR